MSLSISNAINAMNDINDRHLMYFLMLICLLCPGVLVICVFFPHFLVSLDFFKILLLAACYGIASVLIPFMVILSEVESDNTKTQFIWLFIVFVISFGIIDIGLLIIYYLFPNLITIQLPFIRLSGYKSYLLIHVVVMGILLPATFAMKRKKLSSLFKHENRSENK